MTNLTLSHTLAAQSLKAQTLSEQDISAALELIATIKSSGCLAHPYHLKDRDADDLSQLLKDGYPLFGIKNFEGRLISFATVSKLSEQNNTLIVRSLCTLPEYSGLGCGTKIVDAALAWINHHGGSELKAKVASNNRSSLAIFSKAGFAPANLQWDMTDNYWYYMMCKKEPDHKPVQWNTALTQLKCG